MMMVRFFKRWSEEKYFCIRKVTINAGKNNIELFDINFDENFSITSLNSITVNTDKSNFKITSSKKVILVISKLQEKD